MQKNTSTYFDAWMKLQQQSQQQAFAAMREQASQIQSFYENSSAAFSGPAFSSAAMENPFANWSKAAFGAFASNGDASLAPDALFKATWYKAFGGTQAIQKLYELWQPMFEAMRHNSTEYATNPQTYQDLMDPAKVKQIIDQLFNFDMDSMLLLQKQVAQGLAFYEQHSKPWQEAMQKGLSAKPDEQHESVLKSMQNMFSAFGNSAVRMWGIPAVGKHREELELMAQSTAAMSTYAARNIEYQHLMYSTGLEAAQVLAEEVVSKLQAGEKIEDFDTFFALWIDVNEKQFNKLFQTKAFTQKRNALTEAGFKARKLYTALVEDQLMDLPIARRSEMDELYKTVYELRKQVKNLEKQMGKHTENQVQQKINGANHE